MDNYNSNHTYARVFFLFTGVSIPKVVWNKTQWFYLHGKCLVYHRGAEARRPHWSPSSLGFCSGQGQLKQGTQGSVQPGFQYAQGWTSLSNLCQYSVTHTIENNFLNVQTEPPVFEFVPIAFCSLTEQKLRRPWLHHLCTLSSGLYTRWSDSLCAFSSPGWPVSALSAFPFHKDALVPSTFLCPFVGLSNMSTSLLYWGIWNWTLYFQCGFTSAEVKEDTEDLILLHGPMPTHRKPPFSWAFLFLPV